MRGHSLRHRFPADSMTILARVCVVEDDFHAEQMGRFDTRAAADALLAELRADPRSVRNRPPCTNGVACRRVYQMLEYDDSTTPWTLLGSTPAFEIEQGEIKPT